MKVLLNLLAIMLLGAVNLQAQKHDYVWCLWDSVGLDFNHLDESGHPRVFRPTVSSWQQYLSYSSKDGDLQFYLDARLNEQCENDSSIWGAFRNSSNEIIGNGDSIVCNHRCWNSALAAPVRHSDKVYLITTHLELSTGLRGFINSFFYHIADKDSIISKNNRISNDKWRLLRGDERHLICMQVSLILLNTQHDSYVHLRITTRFLGVFSFRNSLKWFTNGVSAIQTFNNEGWWLVTHEAMNDTFVIFLLSNEGLRVMLPKTWTGV